MESISFCYDGRYSDEFNIFNVSIESGLYNEPFVASRKINEVTVKGNPSPYFQGIEYEPLSFNLSFAFDGDWNEGLIREVARWLTPSYYKPLWFVENPSRIYYCMPVNDPQLFHNGLKQGYITLTMRCDSAYAYSPFFTKTIDLSDNEGKVNIELTNGGDVKLYPEIWINKIGNGDFSIINLTNGDKKFSFKDLYNNETIYVNNERKYIESDVVNEYRFSNFNNTYLELVRGVNVLEITGKAKVNFRYQFKLL